MPSMTKSITINGMSIFLFQILLILKHFLQVLKFFLQRERFMMKKKKKLFGARSNTVFQSVNFEQKKSVSVLRFMIIAVYVNLL